jgi:hypothetical protein
MTERAQVLGRADARDLQDVRRVHRAAAHDHLAVRAHRLGGAAAPDLNADAALALEQQAAGLRIGLDAQVRTAARLAQERLRRRAAPAPAPADDLRDWRTRAYAIWFCYVYENFLIIDKPAYSVEELILEFQSPDVLDTPGARIATLWAGAGGSEPSSRSVRLRHVEALRPHYLKAVALLDAWIAGPRDPVPEGQSRRGLATTARDHG